MSEQDSNIRPTEDEDVEAHRKARVMASEEAPKDDESDDDVEAHGRKRVMASDEAPKDEESTEDDVELHGSRNKVK